MTNVEKVEIIKRLFIKTTSKEAIELIAYNEQSTHDKIFIRACELYDAKQMVKYDDLFSDKYSIEIKMSVKDTNLYSFASAIVNIINNLAYAKFHKETLANAGRTMIKNLDGLSYREIKAININLQFCFKYPNPFESLVIIHIGYNYDD